MCWSREESQRNTPNEGFNELDCFCCSWFISSDVPLESQIPQPKEKARIRWTRQSIACSFLAILCTLFSIQVFFEMNLFKLNQ